MKSLFFVGAALLGVVILATVSLGTDSGVGSAQIDRALPGDEIITDPWISIDRAAVFPVSTEVLWPWVKQLGKERGGWYAPMWLENVLKAHSATTTERFQELSVGQVVPDWGGGALKVLALNEGSSIVYGSLRPDEATSTSARYGFTWALVVEPVQEFRSRFQLRLRLRKPDHGVARFIPPQLPGLIDYATDVVMFAGLKEKVSVK